MQVNRYKSGFTLVELLIALLITSIVVGAVATLAFAFGNARDFAEETSRQQSRVRFTTLNLSELIRHCKLVNSLSSDNIVIWKTDDNNDNTININELVFIDRGAERSYIQLVEYLETSSIGFGEVIVPNPGWNKSSVTLMDICENVEFYLDTAPPHTGLVTIAFDIVADNGFQHYQLSSQLRCRADNLLGD